LDPPASVSSWIKTSARVRGEVLRSYLRGHPKELLQKRPRVQWTETIETGKGYRIRKLRYEGYPGMWVPALLYEPTDLAGKVPAVRGTQGGNPGHGTVRIKRVFHGDHVIVIHIAYLGEVVPLHFFKHILIRKVCPALAVGNPDAQDRALQAFQHN